MKNDESKLKKGSFTIPQPVKHKEKKPKGQRRWLKTRKRIRRQQLR